jgi:hypothetical protein
MRKLYFASVTVSRTIFLPSPHHEITKINTCLLAFRARLTYFPRHPEGEICMTKRIAILTVAAGAIALSLAFAGSASAQTPKTGRSAISKECSTKADEQKLHGKERRKFRSKCIKDAKKKA